MSFFFYSNGEILILTPLANVKYRLFGKLAVEDVSTTTFSHAVAGLAFLPPDKREEGGR